MGLRMSDRQFNSLAQAYDINNTGKINYQEFIRKVAATVVPAQTGNLKVKSLSRLTSSADDGHGGTTEPKYPFEPEDTRRRRRHPQLAEQPTLAKWIETKFARRAVADTTALARVFRRYDKSGTGTIAIADFQRALRQMNIRLSRKQLDVLVPNIALQGDKTRISLRSFADVVARHFVAKAENKSMVDLESELEKAEAERAAPRPTSDRAVKAAESALANKLFRNYKRVQDAFRKFDSNHVSTNGHYSLVAAQADTSCLLCCRTAWCPTLSSETRWSRWAWTCPTRSSPSL